MLGLEVKQEQGDHYAVASIPGVLHFGTADRRAAAESTFCNREYADRISLGFAQELKVDNLQDAGKRIEGCGWEVTQGARAEPWGQKALRVLSPGGGLLGSCRDPMGSEYHQTA